MAPEVMGIGEYSFSADVWSFGVVMWEIATQRDPDLFAELSMPFPRGPPLAVMRRALDQDGLRLPVPDEFNETLRKLLQRCWSGEPISRPSFREITHVLQQAESF